MTPSLFGRARRIVVGVDGSPCSREALGWAARQASLTGEPLTVVTTWSMPTSYGWSPPPPDSLDLQHEIATMQARVVNEVIGENPPFAVELQVLPGHPAPVLTELSADADLVVVGSRGHGGFVGALLGSVSEHLTTHARCPVVVVRPGTCSADAA
jgi:nucleotide-binding universal stress UspA family protein